MSSSNIVVRVKYQNCNDLRKSVGKTISYISDKKKADATSIDEYDILKDYMQFANNDSYLYEDKESFTWSSNGDIDARKDLLNMNELDSKGTLWSLVISFPPEFAINNGLITKVDYYNLTKNIMPQLLTGMGFKMNNVTWYCSLHRNTDNPHLHINFFEHHKTISNPKVPYDVIHKLKSNIANYLIDNEKFYKLRDEEFKSITGSISLAELTRIKNQKLFGDKYRRDLNNMLLNLYEILPPKGRLQYNSKNMTPYKSQLNNIIEYILLHDSTKYKYARYIKLLDEHQKELTAIYGSSSANKNIEYYNNQINKLYAKIGNEILSNYKIYQSMETMEKEKEFLKKHIKDLKFKSSAYKKQDNIDKVAKDLNRICNLAGLNLLEKRYVFKNWISRSKYNINVDALLSSMDNINTDMSSTEYYNILNKLNYNYDRYSKYKNKMFYQELNYKKFINQAMNYLEYELEQEEKQIINELEYDLSEY